MIRVALITEGSRGLRISFCVGWPRGTLECYNWLSPSSSTDSEPFKRRREKAWKMAWSLWHFQSVAMMHKNLFLTRRALMMLLHIFRQYIILYSYTHVDKRHKHSSGQTIWKASRSTFKLSFLQQVSLAAGPTHTWISLPPNWSSFSRKLFSTFVLYGKYVWDDHIEWGEPTGSYRLPDWVWENSRSL